MGTVSIVEAATHLSRLVEQAAAGEEIIIAKAGRPMARLVPLATPGRKHRRLGILAGKLAVPDDIDSGFADEIEQMFQGSGASGEAAKSGDE